MPPKLALFVYVCFVLWLLARDRKREGLSSASWIPTCWVAILASRPASTWLGLGGQIRSADDYLDDYARSPDRKKPRIDLAKSEEWPMARARAANPPTAATATWRTCLFNVETNDMASPLNRNAAYCSRSFVADRRETRDGAPPDPAEVPRNERSRYDPPRGRRSHARARAGRRAVSRLDSRVHEGREARGLARARLGLGSAGDRSAPHPIGRALPVRRARAQPARALPVLRRVRQSGRHDVPVRSCANGTGIPGRLLGLRAFHRQQRRADVDR